MSVCTAVVGVSSGIDYNVINILLYISAFRNFLVATICSRLFFHDGKPSSSRGCRQGQHHQLPVEADPEGGQFDETKVGMKRQDTSWCYYLDLVDTAKPAETPTLCTSLTRAKASALLSVY